MSAYAEPTPTQSQQRLREAVSAAGQVVLGKEQEIRLSIACLLGQGHLLIEDVPGVGKTTLAHALARVFDLEYRRIQFTSDLLPADVLGASIYERDSGRFRFHPGPIFTQLALADEINRAPPKTQSALLEAMEEEQVSIEGETRRLPQPFFVIATQNPREQAGTFPLPESQLDRFLMQISLGFPGREAERDLLSGNDRRHLAQTLTPVMNATELVGLQQVTKSIHTSPALLDYVQGILAASRVPDRFVAGLSPRAGIDLIAAARAWALLEGREYVLPEDVQRVLGAVVNHRLQPLESAADARPDQLLMDAVAVD